MGTLGIIIVLIFISISLSDLSNICKYLDNIADELSELRKTIAELKGTRK